MSYDDGVAALTPDPSRGGVQRSAGPGGPSTADANGEAPMPDLSDAADALAEYRANEKRAEAERAALRQHGSQTFVCPGKLKGGGGDWTRRLLDFGRQHPGHGVVELLEAFWRDNANQAPPGQYERTSFARLGDDLRRAKRARRAYVFGDFRAAASAGRFASAVSGDGWDVRTAIPALPGPLLEALFGGHLGLAPGDDLLFYYAGSVDDPGSPSLLSRAQVQQLVARGKAAGLHVTAVLDVHHRHEDLARDLATPTDEDAAPTNARYPEIAERLHAIAATLPPPHPAEGDTGSVLQFLGYYRTRYYEPLRRSGAGVWRSMLPCLSLLPPGLRASPPAASLRARDAHARASAAELRAQLEHDREGFVTAAGDALRVRHQLVEALVALARRDPDRATGVGLTTVPASEALGGLGTYASVRYALASPPDTAPADPAAATPPRRLARVLMPPASAYAAWEQRGAARFDSQKLHGHAGLAAAGGQVLGALGYDVAVVEASAGGEAMAVIQQLQAQLRPGDEVALYVVAPHAEGLLHFGHGELPLAALAGLSEAVSSKGGSACVAVAEGREWVGATGYDTMNRANHDGAAELASGALAPFTLELGDTPLVADLVGTAELVRVDLLRLQRREIEPEGALSEASATGLLARAAVDRWVVVRADLPPLERVLAAWRALALTIGDARKNIGAGLGDTVDHARDELSARIIGSAHANQVAADHNSFTRALLADGADDVTASAEETAASFRRPHQQGIATKRGAKDAEGAKHALVIGNGAHYPFAPLAGAPRDARQMAARYTSEGFTVDHREELPAAAMTAAIRGWAGDARQGEHRALYFAGHGTPTGLVGTGATGEIVPNYVVSGAVADVRARPAQATVVIDACHSGAAVETATVALTARPLLPKLAHKPRDDEGATVLLGVADEVRELYAVVYGTAQSVASRGDQAFAWARDHVARLIQRLDDQGVAVGSLRESLGRDLRDGEVIGALWAERVRSLELLYQKLQERLRQVRADAAKARWLRGEDAADTLS